MSERDFATKMTLLGSPITVYNSNSFNTAASTFSNFSGKTENEEEKLSKSGEEKQDPFQQWKKFEVEHFQQRQQKYLPHLNDANAKEQARQRKALLKTFLQWKQQHTTNLPVQEEEAEKKKKTNNKPRFPRTTTAEMIQMAEDRHQQVSILAIERKEHSKHREEEETRQDEEKDSEEDHLTKLNSTEQKVIVNQNHTPDPNFLLATLSACDILSSVDGVLGVDVESNDDDMTLDTSKNNSCNSIDFVTVDSGTTNLENASVTTKELDHASIAATKSLDNQIFLFTDKVVDYFQSFNSAFKTNMVLSAMKIRKNKRSYRTTFNEDE